MIVGKVVVHADGAMALCVKEDELAIPIPTAKGWRSNRTFVLLETKEAAEFRVAERIYLTNKVISVLVAK